jgi:AmmeMemoRadiSam system protein A
MRGDRIELRPYAASLLTADERAELLDLARAAIGAALGLADPPEPRLRSAGLLGPGGVFVTLHLAGNLRGCIGTLNGEESPLYENVIRTARAAAFEDPRFPPLTAVEWGCIHIEISRLSALQRLAPEHVIAGLHGVHIARGPARALLLPQVARHRGWDSQRLLREVCRKAGLAEDAWQEVGTELSVFTAEVFGSEPTAPG